jgi:hypothetical protein
MKAPRRQKDDSNERLTIATVFLFALHTTIHLFGIGLVSHSPFWAAMTNGRYGAFGLSVLDVVVLIGALTIFWAIAHLYRVWNAVSRWTTRVAAIVLVIASMGTMRYACLLRAGAILETEMLVRQTLRSEQRLDTNWLRGSAQYQMRKADIQRSWELLK